MAAGVVIKHKRKTTPFVPASDLVAGEIGINTGTPRLEYSPDGTNNFIVANRNLTPPGTDGLSDGPTTNAFNCGFSSSAVGDLVYLDSSGTWQKADANVSAAMGAMLGIALEVKASGNALLVALPGSFVYATAFPTLTVGSPVYMSETAGAVTQTQPTTTDAAIRVIGWAVHADKIYFNPSPDYITHT